MTAGTFVVDATAVSIQAVITANATTSSRISLSPKFKDKIVIVIHQVV